MKYTNFYLVLIPIFFSNFIQAQNSPYQSECAKFEGKSSFQCSAYSNCRLMGGSVESCKSSSGSDKRFTDSQSEIDERKMLEKEKKDKQSLELQQKQYQQQYLQQQYQQQKR